MDEKTEQLRDIFVDVADDETVTESQEESRGSLLDAGGDAGDADDRLTDVIERMRERYDFETDLGTDSLCRLVVAYYDGDGDGEIAERLDVSRSTAVLARLDLHLVRDDDTDLPVDADRVRERIEDGASPTQLAEEFDVDVETVRVYRRALDARARSRRANERYRDAFDEILGETDLSARLAEGVREDGLAEATEDIETDVEF